MKKYTSIKRTEEYLKELMDWIPKKSYGFPHNDKEDVLLILNPVELYDPFADETWKNGGHVSKKYFIRGLDFLKNQPVTIKGYSNINYSDPDALDLRIIYNGTLKFPLEITKLKEGWEEKENLPPLIKNTYNILNREDFNKKIFLYVDAYEWEYLDSEKPSYIWLPHQNKIEDFKKLLPEFIKNKKHRKDLEKILTDYYSN